MDSSYFPLLPRRDEHRTRGCQSGLGVNFRFWSDDSSDDVTHECGPAFGFRQLRRSREDRVQTSTNAADHRLDLITGGVRQGEQEAALARMLGQSSDAREQQGARRDRFEPCLRMRQSHIPTPPVVDQRHSARRQIAALQILRGIAAPAPGLPQLRVHHQSSSSSSSVTAKPSSAARNSSDVAASSRLVLMLVLMDLSSRMRLSAMWRTSARLWAM